ncbi:hypothetical protein D3C73_947480 [compost metagenome]
MLAVYPLGHSPDRTSMQADQLRILPAVPKPGKSQLDTAVMRNHFDMLRPESADKIPGNPKEQRVTGGQHHRTPLLPHFLQLIGKSLQTVLQNDLFPLIPAEKRQLPLPAEQHLAPLHLA